MDIPISLDSNIIYVRGFIAKRITPNIADANHYSQMTQIENTEKSALRHKVGRQGPDFEILIVLLLSDPEDICDTDMCDNLLVSTAIFRSIVWRPPVATCNTLISRNRTS